jgi:uncharacterized protein
VAYSGGVDSTFLLKVALETLGRDKVLGLTVQHDTLTASDIQIAREVAEEHDFPHEIITYSELGIESFAQNPPERCYICKHALFGLILEEAERRGLQAVLEASNADDAGDYRPGMRATAELGVKTPLREAGLTKAEIRLLARGKGLPNWNRPSEACLATRFPYGETLTREKLARVAEAEDCLHELGLQQVRVRHHGDVARIEVLPEDIHRLTDPSTREGLLERFSELGFKYVALDLRGYRTGSMNESLTESTDA